MTIEKTLYFREYQSRLSANLKYLIQNRNISTLELSSRLGLAYASVYAAVNATANPTLESLVKMSEFFNISIGQLMGDTSITSPNFVHTIPIINWSDILIFLNQSANFCQFKDNLIISSNLSESNMFAVHTNKKVSTMFPVGTILIFNKISTDLIHYDQRIVLTLTNGSLLNIKILFIEGTDIFLKNPDLDVSPQKLTNNIEVIAYLHESHLVHT